MIHHQVNDQIDIPFSAFLHQLLEVLHGSVNRIDGHIILHIVFMIGIGRHNGHKPYAADPKIRVSGTVAVIEIIQLFRNPRQVADTVSIAVVEGIHKYFIKGTIFVRGLRHPYLPSRQEAGSRVDLLLPLSASSAG